MFLLKCLPGVFSHWMHRSRDFCWFLEKIKLLILHPGSYPIKNCFCLGLFHPSLSSDHSIGFGVFYKLLTFWGEKIRCIILRWQVSQTKLVGIWNLQDIILKLSVLRKTTKQRPPSPSSRHVCHKTRQKFLHSSPCSSSCGCEGVDRSHLSDRYVICTTTHSSLPSSDQGLPLISKKKHLTVMWSEIVITCPGIEPG